MVMFHHVPPRHAARRPRGRGVGRVVPAGVAALAAATLASPGTAMAVTGNADGSFTIDPGDTLSRIAYDYGDGSWAGVLGMRSGDPDLIYPGEVLRDASGSIRVPVGVVASSSDLSALARDVIAGKYGNGMARRAALGDRYDAVQALVDDILDGPRKAPAGSTSVNPVAVFGSQASSPAQPAPAHQTVAHQAPVAPAPARQPTWVIDVPAHKVRHAASSKVVHHDAVYKTVHHDAVTHTEDRYYDESTPSGTSQASPSSHTSDWAETRHVDATVKQVMDQPAHDETVVDVPAHEAPNPAYVPARPAVTHTETHDQIYYVFSDGHEMKYTGPAGNVVAGHYFADHGVSSYEETRPETVTITDTPAQPAQGSPTVTVLAAYKQVHVDATYRQVVDQPAHDETVTHYVVSLPTTVTDRPAGDDQVLVTPAKYETVPVPAYDEDVPAQGHWA